MTIYPIDTPKQNEVVERKHNDHLLARSLNLQSKVPCFLERLLAMCFALN